MSSVNSIRSTFLDFFATNDHTIVPSSPLVPRNDPTLLFTNSGMVQFKDVFTGLEKRPYRRATTSQKCVRAGGKHNDLDNVGYTARHHTFFEMLGNFSFGDYFKERAIELAWKLSTEVFGLSKDRLIVTVFHDDDDAFNLWRKISGLSDSCIIRIPTSDNFWAMGDTGPCGPCSEIFFDQGDKVCGGPPGSADEDGDRFLEFWNLVFMQFEQVSPGERLALPRPSIDTGLGLERLACLLQGVTSNFDIDLMRTLIVAAAHVTATDPDGPQKVSHRIIADHLRSSAFLVADGVLPSNEGRGYVLRRIMRRAMRHVQLLGAREPVMWRLVPVLVKEMGQAYPELVRAEALIAETLKLEETRFRLTLSRGVSILEEETQALKAGDAFSGKTAFKLYDTYGFPLDLTQDALRVRGISVDLAGFDEAMAQQKSEARKAWAGSGEAATEAIWFGLREEIGPTEFLGYTAKNSAAVVKAIIRDGERVERLKSGEMGWVVLNQTPFYGESGGQIGDSGILHSGEVKAKIDNTLRRLGDIFIHHTIVEMGELTLGQCVELNVEASRRGAIAANHSATHLLHEALRQVLGDHVAQKGSLVADDRLRFDFAHQKSLTVEELAKIEAITNQMILRNEPINTRLMDVETAINSGARALFGEKYGDEVRVVSMGTVDGDTKAFSVELCGGTHAARTGDIGLLSIVAEGAVASGVRRIEAKTGLAAREQLNQESRQLRQLASLLRTPIDEAGVRLTQLLEERKKLERDLAEARRKLVLQRGDTANNRNIHGVSFYTQIVEAIDTKDLRSLAEESRDKLGSGVVALVNVAADLKASLIVAVSKDLILKINAIELVRAAAPILGGGGGGGRPDMAQAGGPNGDKAQQALDVIADSLEAMLGRFSGNLG